LPPGCLLLPPATGKQGTRLDKPTAAVAAWLVEFKKSDIADSQLRASIGGKLLDDLLALVAAKP
jgi:hypothetical protein